jgi:hypothetical protein
VTVQSVCIELGEGNFITRKMPTTKQFSSRVMSVRCRRFQVMDTGKNVAP